MCTETLGRSHVFPWLVEKPALVPNALRRGGGLPRAYLAVKLEIALYMDLFNGVVNIHL